MSNSLPSVRRHRPLSLRSLRALVLVLVVGVGLALSPATPAAAAMSSRESSLAVEFLAQLNSERAARGLAPMVIDTSITPDAVDWANDLAGDQSLSHSNDGRAEIVARGYRTGQISEAWMESSGHRNLVVDPNLGYAGVGVACDGNGQMWAVVQFRRINTKLGTQTSSNSSPVVTSDGSGSTCKDVPANTVNSIKRLYSAYFLRDADTNGLNYWKSQALLGVGIPAMSDVFADSTEFRARYGSLSNREFVRLVYQNVMDRDPDPGGYDYWIGQMNKGLSRGQVMTNFSESVEYRTKTGLS